MKRIFVLISLAVLATVAGAVFWNTQRSTGPGAAAKPDSVWYHASDVALLATTGQPQLVEFFHPN
jgi:hypothetical protein